MLPRLYLPDSENRKRQITTLKVFNDNVTEVLEGSEYNISFTAGENNFILSVTLSSNFPQDKPIIKISPVIIHSWVNSEGEVISAPGLLNFTVHSDLGRVVQAIIREFERNPPPLITDPVLDDHVSSKSTAADQLISPSFASNFSTLSNLPTTSSHMPVATTFRQSMIFPELNSLPLEELEFLNENVDRQYEFITDIPQIREQNRLLNEVLDNIEALAGSNLAKQARLEELKNNIESRVDEVSKLALENERLHDIYSSLSMKYAPRNIQKQLKLAAQKAECESEKVAESFINGEIDVDKFVSSYAKLRALCQSRKTKEEKLGQQLDELERAGY